jgi:SAM-dependent methyltransferase
MGLSWRDRATLPSLRAVLDPGDARGYKNRFIDGIHRQAVRTTLSELMRRRGGRFAQAMDFGCGTGRMIAELAAVADTVVGVDPSPDMIARAQERGIVPPDRLVVWRDGPLPFADGSIDLILSVYVMMTTATLEVAVPAWRRVCVPGAVGLLIEQIDTSRGLTMDRYRETLAAAGFRIELARPIRRGGGSLFLLIAIAARWPRRIVDVLARLEMRAIRGRSLPAGDSGYWDYVFVVRRVPAVDPPTARSRTAASSAARFTRS